LRLVTSPPDGDDLDLAKHSAHLDTELSSPTQWLGSPGTHLLCVNGGKSNNSGCAASASVIN
jgi:hypothetical protein